MSKLLFVRVIECTNEALKKEELLNQRNLLDVSLANDNIKTILTVDNGWFVWGTLDANGKGLERFAPNWIGCSNNTKVSRELGTVEPRHVFVYVMDDIIGTQWLTKQDPVAICGVLKQMFKTESIIQVISEAVFSQSEKYIYNANEYPDLDKDLALERSYTDT